MVDHRRRSSEISPGCPGLELTEVAVLVSIPRLLRCLVAFACLAGACAAQSDSLSLSLNPGTAAGFVSLNLSLTSAPGAEPAGIQWTLNYPASDVVGFVATAGPSATAADKTVVCSGNLCLLYGPQQANPIQNGVVAVLTFQLASSASSQVAFQVSDALAASPQGNPMPVSTSSALISVVPQPPAFPPAVSASLALAGSAAEAAWSGGWDTTMNLINTGTRIANARLQHFNQNGNLLSLPLLLPQGSGPPATLLAPSLDQTLYPRATVVIDNPGLDLQPTQIGSAQLSTDGNVGGFIRFRYGPRDQEAALPLETRNASSYVLAFDNANGNATGVALANLTAAVVNVQVVIRNDAGIQIDSTTLSLPADGQTAFTLGDQIASTVNLTGTVQFNTPGGGQISVLGMRFPPSGRFTTIPVVSVADPGNGSMAHLAVGGGWTTTIQLINFGNATGHAHLRFFDDNGAALMLPITSPGSTQATASLDPVLLPNATLTLQSSGLDGSPVQIGSARLTSDGSVTGFIRFTYGPRDQDAIVPLETRNAASYILAFDNTNGLATGVAVANIASAPANIAVAIRDTTGAQLGFETLTIPANGHSAFVLSDRFTETVNQRGSVQFATPSGGQISVLGMRFLASGTFSTIPVLTP